MAAGFTAALGAGLGKALPAVAKGTVGGGRAPAPSVSTLNDRSLINVAPVGVNVGEIMKPYDQGGSTNGGYGLRTSSRLVDSGSLGGNPGAGFNIGGNVGGDTLQTLFIAGAVLAGGVALFAIMRR